MTWWRVLLNDVELTWRSVSQLSGCFWGIFTPFWFGFWNQCLSCFFVIFSSWFGSLDPLLIFSSDAVAEHVIPWRRLFLNGPVRVGAGEIVNTRRVKTYFWGGETLISTDHRHSWPLFIVVTVRINRVYQKNVYLHNGEHQVTGWVWGQIMLICSRVLVVFISIQVWLLRSHLPEWTATRQGAKKQSSDLSNSTRQWSKILSSGHCCKTQTYTEFQSSSAAVEQQKKKKSKSLIGR